jgi:hypothetical protein
MTPKQFDEFTRQLFLAFPSFNSSLETHSPDKSGTLRIWYGQLEHIEFTEAMEVLGNWIHGRREPPKAFEYDRVALIVRASALFVRDSQRKGQENDRRAREKKDATGTRRALAGLGIDEAYLKGSELKQRLASGEMSVYEFNEQVAKIVQEVA